MTENINQNKQEGEDQRGFLGMLLDDKAGEDVQSPERRLFLQKAKDLFIGGGAFVLAMLHPRLLKAIEFPPGTGWEDGLERLHDTVSGRIEHLGLYAGTRQAGRWFHGVDGHESAIYGNVAQLGETIVRKRNEEGLDLEGGTAVYHTHTNRTIEFLYDSFTMTRKPPSFDSPEDMTRHAAMVQSFIGAPSYPDIGLTTDGLLERYLRLANVQHARVEYGVVAGPYRWAAHKIDFATLPRVAQNEAAHAFAERKQRAYQSIAQETKAYLAKNQNIANKLFNRMGSPAWNRVINSDSERLDMLTDLVIHRGPLFGDVLMLELAAAEGGGEWNTHLREYWRTFSPIVLAGREHLRLTEELYNKRIQLPEAHQLYKDFMRDKCGVFVSIIPYVPPRR